MSFFDVEVPATPHDSALQECTYSIGWTQLDNEVADLAADALQLAAPLARWSYLLCSCLPKHVLLLGIRYRLP